jgi:hypothetical protein
MRYEWSSPRRFRVPLRTRVKTFMEISIKYLNLLVRPRGVEPLLQE